MENFVKYLACGLLFCLISLGKISIFLNVRLCLLPVKKQQQKNGKKTKKRKSNLSAILLINDMWY